MRNWFQDEYVRHNEKSEILKDGNLWLVFFYRPQIYRIENSKSSFVLWVISNFFLFFACRFSSSPQLLIQSLFFSSSAFETHKYRIERWKSWWKFIFGKNSSTRRRGRERNCENESIKKRNYFYTLLTFSFLFKIHSFIPHTRWMGEGKKKKENSCEKKALRRRSHLQHVF